MSETAFQAPSVLAKDREFNPASHANFYVNAAILRIIDFLEAAKRKDVAELEDRGISFVKAKKLGARMLIGAAVAKGVISAELVAAASSSEH